MLIIFNLIGAGILILATVIGSLTALLFGAKTEPPLVMAVTGLVAVVLDVLYRKNREEASMLHPRRGGHVFFIPVWIIGLGFIGMGGIGMLTWTPPAGRESARAVQTNRPPPAAGSRGGYAAFPVHTNEPFAGLKLNMVSGSGPHGLAVINRENFAVSETHRLDIAQQTITVTCLEVRDQSVLVQVEGESQPRELKFGDAKPLAAAP